jgi:Fe-S-cluster-containing dehydrogenase component
MAKYGMAIDLARCMGCRACNVACKEENGTPAGHLWMYTYRFTEGSYPNTNVRFMPRPCFHCETPGCVTACKWDSRIKWKDGFVLTDVDKCQGDTCGRPCEAGCVYNLTYFNIDDPKGNQYLDWDDPNAVLGGMWPNWTPDLVKEYTNPADPTKQDRRVAGAGYRKDTVGKCTFCVHRIENGETETACQRSCPVTAIIFGDLDDSNSEVSKAIAGAAKSFQLKTAAGTKPKVWYLNADPPNNPKLYDVSPIKTGIQIKGDPKIGNGTVPW